MLDWCYWPRRTLFSLSDILCWAYARVFHYEHSHRRSGHPSGWVEPPPLPDVHRGTLLLGGRRWQSGHGTESLHEFHQWEVLQRGVSTGPTQADPPRATHRLRHGPLLRRHRGRPDGPKHRTPHQPRRLREPRPDVTARQAVYINGDAGATRVRRVVPRDGREAVHVWQQHRRLATGGVPLANCRYCTRAGRLRRPSHSLVSNDRRGFGRSSPRELNHDPDQRILVPGWGDHSESGPGRVPVDPDADEGVPRRTVYPVAQQTVHGRFVPVARGAESRPLQRDVHLQVSHEVVPWVSTHCHHDVCLPDRFVDTTRLRVTGRLHWKYPS